MLNSFVELDKFSNEMKTAISEAEFMSLVCYSYKLFSLKLAITQ
jgi:hypothetical protein